MIRLLILTALLTGCATAPPINWTAGYYDDFNRFHQHHPGIPDCTATTLTNDPDRLARGAPYSPVCVIESLRLPDLLVGDHS